MSDDAIAVLGHQIAAMHGDLMQRLGGVTTHFERLFEGISTRVDSLSERMGNLETQLSAQGERFDRTRVEMMERMDRLQDTMTSMKDEVNVNYFAGERTERIARLVSDDNRDMGSQVSVRRRQIFSLRQDVDALKNGRGH